MGDIFGVEEAMELTVVRRPFTVSERVHMYRMLVRTVVAGAVAEFRELLREGAQPNFKLEATGFEDSVFLSHWGDVPEIGASSEAASFERREQRPKLAGKSSQSNGQPKEDVLTFMPAPGRGVPI